MDECRGPIDAEGCCRWCKHQHEAVSQHATEGGTLAKVYPVKCAEPWPDRPRRKVNPEFVPVQGRLMRFKCWACGGKATLNSFIMPNVFHAVLQGGTVGSYCNTCGMGIDLEQGQIILS